MSERFTSLFLPFKLMGYSVLILLVSMLYLVTTESGTQALFGSLSAHYSKQFAYSRVNGSLSHGLKFEDLVLKTSSFELTALKLAIDWTPLSILKGHLKIEALVGEELHLHIPSIKSREHTKTPWIGPFTLNSLDLHQLSLTVDNTPVAISRVYLEKWTPFDSRWPKALSLQSSLGQMTVSNDHIHAKWNGDLTWIAPWLKLSVENLHSHGEIEGSTHHLKDSHIDLECHAKALTFHEDTFEQFQFRLTGKLSHHQGHWHIQHTAHQFQGQLSGSMVNETTWQGKLSKLLWQPSTQSPWPNFEAELTITQDHASYLVHLRSELWGQNPLDGHLSLPLHSDGPLKGHFQAEFSDLQILKKRLPFFHNVKGSLQFKSDIHGQLNAPKFQLWTQIKGFKWTIPQYSTHVTMDTLTIFEAPDSNGLKIKGQGKMGEGTFQLNGIAQNHLKGPKIQIHVTGEHLCLSNTPDYQIYASPNLTLSNQGKTLSLQGQLQIPKAQIDIKEIGSKISPSEDVTIVGSHRPSHLAPSLSPLIQTDLELNLGEDIHFKGFGLHTKLGGQLRLKSSMDASLRATGKIHLKEGKYRSLGKVLDIDHGHLLYSGGPLSDPQVDLSASRVLKSNSDALGQSQSPPLKVGISLSGPLKSPKLGVWSTPQLPSADIMSYLILDRSHDQINNAQAQILFQSLSEFSKKWGLGSDQTTLDLAETLKLDQLGFVTGEQSQSKNPLEETALVIGKQLSSRLYFQYSFGLLDTSSNFGLKYLLGKYLTFQAKTGSKGHGADLLLTIEKE